MMKRLIAILLVLAVLAVGVLYFFPDRMPPALQSATRIVHNWVDNIRRLVWPEPEADPDEQACKVLYVIDGDTLVISVAGEKTTVRLIGVDAPESVHPDAEKNTPEGEQASQWLEHLVTGRLVTLEYDEEMTDRYGRTLAYVYLDGVLLQDALLTAGLARTLTMEPNTRYQRHFEQIEKKAEENNTGFWDTGFFEP